MNQHLSSKQISGWLLGEHSHEAESHVRVCSSCRQELHQFQAALSGFRNSMRHWSDHQLTTTNHTVPTAMGKAHSFAVKKLAYALAVCLVVVLGTVPAFWRRHNNQPSSAEIVTDAKLMTQVDQEISRTVPESMEPLMQLVSWDDRNDSEMPSAENDRNDSRGN